MDVEDNETSMKLAKLKLRKWWEALGAERYVWDNRKELAEVLLRRRACAHEGSLSV